MKRIYSLGFFFAMICGLFLNGCSSDNAATQGEKDELNDDPKTVVINSSECDIIEFTDEVNLVNWEIKDTNIIAVYPADSDLSSITPVITISEKATVSPQSGEKVDFSNENEVTYIVTAEDGTEKIYKAQAIVTCTVNNECDWKKIQSNVLTEQLNTTFNVFFSSDNELVANIQGDTLLYVINNMDELLNLSNSLYTPINFDFEKQSIIWGRIFTSSVSNTISSKQLFKCKSSSQYKYNVIVDKCIDCWTATGYLYFWEVYPRKIDVNKVSLIVNDKP